MIARTCTNIEVTVQLLYVVTAPATATTWACVSGGTCGNCVLGFAVCHCASRIVHSPCSVAMFDAFRTCYSMSHIATATTRILPSPLFDHTLLPTPLASQCIGSYILPLYQPATMQLNTWASDGDRLNDTIDRSPVTRCDERCTCTQLLLVSIGNLVRPIQSDAIGVMSTCCAAQGETAGQFAAWRLRIASMLTHSGSSTSACGIFTSALAHTVCYVSLLQLSFTRNKLCKPASYSVKTVPRRRGVG